jgi:hypothetical protein
MRLERGPTPVRCWVARSASKTHVRIQFDPFEFPWPGWDLFEGTISQQDAKALEAFPIDPVELERLHQEAFLRAQRLGKPVTFGDVATAPAQDFA